VIADFVEAVVHIFWTFLDLLRRPRPDESQLVRVGRLVGLPVFGALALLALAVLVTGALP
jgi:hypothetical protein